MADDTPNDTPVIMPDEAMHAALAEGLKVLCLVRPLAKAHAAGGVSREALHLACTQGVPALKRMREAIDAVGLVLDRTQEAAYCDPPPAGALKLQSAAEIPLHG